MQPTRVHFLLLFAVSVWCHRAAHASASRIATGTDTNSLSHVNVFTHRTQTSVASFFAYPTAFQGGVRVAAGDVNGDGAADIVTGAGPGAGPHVKVFSGASGAELYSFFAFDPGFSGGVFVAAGDVNGDGFADIVVAPDQGGPPHVRVFSGATGAEIRSFFAYATGFTGGVRVGAGDVNGDGVADIITGTGPGAPGHVKVFEGTALGELHSFFAYDPGFTGGIHVAAGDLNGDGRADVITGAGPGAGPHVKAFNGVGAGVLHSFFAYAAGFQGGVTVASGDLDGDGRAELITAPGPGGAPQIRILDGANASELATFPAYPQTYTNGVFVAASSLVRPALRIRELQGGVQLSWPAAEVCVLETNSVLEKPSGWGQMDAKAEINGNRAELWLPVQNDANGLFFRLTCPDEGLR